MTRRQYIGALVVLAASGLLGGALCTLLVPGQAAWAQEDVPPAEPRLAAVPKEVRAERFALVDEAGDERAVLRIAGGQPQLVLSDGECRPRLLIRTLDGEPAITLHDETGETRMMLRLLNDKMTLSFFRGGDARAVFDEESLWFTDGDRVRAAFGFVRKDEPKLALVDAAGLDRVILGSTRAVDERTGAETRSPISTITLFNETGLQWQAP
jgi:hypothetical protein